MCIYVTLFLFLYFGGILTAWLYALTAQLTDQNWLIPDLLSVLCSFKILKFSFWENACKVFSNFIVKKQDYVHWRNKEK